MNWIKFGLLLVFIIAAIGGFWAFYNYWNWLKDPDNRGIVALLLTIFIAIFGGGCALYLHLSKTPSEEVKPSIIGIVAGRDIIPGRDIINIQLTPAQTEQFLKNRGKEILSALPKADPKEREVLERELESVKAKYDNLQKAHEEQKAKLAEAYKALEDFKREFTPDQVKQAQKALAQGKTGNAEAFFQKALDQRTTQAAEAAYYLGVLAESRIDYVQAEKYYKKAVELQPDNPRYLNYLGNLQHRSGHYGEAQPHLEQALQIREKTLGADHLDVATSLNNLAALYKAQGNYAKAELLYQRALKICEKALGPDHPNVSICLGNYANMLKEIGREAEAATLEARVQAIRAKQASKDQ